jgi:glycosyltransferase involved in cell wall biosynthesis
MKIVHIHHHYWPVVGGLENVVKALAEGMARLGHEVHVITSIYGAENRSREEVINNMCIHRVKSIRFKFSDLIYPLEIPLKLIENADIVQGYSQNSIFTYKICKEAKKLGKRVIMYFLGVDYLEKHYNPLIRVLGYPYQKWITREVVKITDLALVTNDYERKLLRERYGIESIVVPHGIDEIYLKYPNMEKYFREKYGIENKIISYIGRIHSTKGIDLLIRAFAIVSKKYPDTVLVIAGRGDDNYLKKILRIAEALNINNIRYLGYVSEEDKIALIDASEAIVLPTKHAGESYPIIMNEVLARNKPLIITNINEVLASYTKIYRCLYISDPDPESLSSKIIHIIEHNYSKCEGNKILSWNEIVEKLLYIYSNLLVK